MNRFVTNFAKKLIAFVLFLSGTTSVFGYTMSEYFPLTDGNYWLYDRNLFLVSGEEKDFGGKTGKNFIDAREIYDAVLYFYDGNGTVSLIGLKEEGSSIDLSATPVVVVAAEMNEGDGGVVSVVPAGKLGLNSITVTSTLDDVVPTLTVPAGTFSNTLKIKLVIDEVAYSYTEYLWLAKGIGPVKIARGSYTSNDGACFFTCGCFDSDSEVVETLMIQLTGYFQSDYSDTDGDGVIDKLDDCANTPDNSLVDSKGCPGTPKTIVVPIPF